MTNPLRSATRAGDEGRTPAATRRGQVTKFTDQAYLLNDQYKDASNLNARIELHKRFSTSPRRWQYWVFDHFQIDPSSRVLELGCGPGGLWSENIDRVPDSWDMTLSDFSPGMLREAEQNLRRTGRAFRFEVFDAQSIPYDDAHFDTVIANHMLFHVPDRPRALSEIRRVLKPGGRFYATTMCRAHLREIDELIHRFDPAVAFWDGHPADRFTLESGLDELKAFYSDVVLHRHADALIVTEAQPLIDYILTGVRFADAVEKRRAEFARFVEEELAARGSLTITKDSGMFEAR